MHNIDTRLIGQRFQRALNSYDQHAVVQQAMCRKLVSMLGQAVTGPLGNVLEIGCGTGMLTREILQCFLLEHYWANDLVSQCELAIRDVFSNLNPVCEWRFLPGDIEQVELPDALDLVVSSAVFQWIARPRELLLRIAEALKPGGLLLVATFGPSNLQEIRQLTGSALSYRSLEQFESMLPDRLSLCKSTQSEDVLYFRTPLDVLRHLKLTGVSGIRRTRWNRKRLAVFSDAYRHSYHDESGYRLTYNPLYFLLRKNDDCIHEIECTETV